MKCTQTCLNIQYGTLDITEMHRHIDYNSLKSSCCGPTSSSHYQPSTLSTNLNSLGLVKRHFLARVQIGDATSTSYQQGEQRVPSSGIYTLTRVCKEVLNLNYQT